MEMCAGCRNATLAIRSTSCSECGSVYCEECCDDHLDGFACACCGPSMFCNTCGPDPVFKVCTYCGADTCPDCERRCYSSVCSVSFVGSEVTVCKACSVKCTHCGNVFCPLHVHYCSGRCSDCFLRDHVESMTSLVLSTRHNSKLRELSRIPIRLISRFVFHHKRGYLMVTRELSALNLTSFRGRGIFMWVMPCKEHVRFAIDTQRMQLSPRLSPIDLDTKLTLSRCPEKSHVVIVMLHT